MLNNSTSQTKINMPQATTSQANAIMRPNLHRCRGFTLIELLIVIAIVSLLAQMLLPAIQHAREVSRITQCQNNLRQLGIAFQSHISQQGYLPSSGWGWQWVGHPDRGFGKEQPGGWAFNVLPYLEGQNLRSKGAGLEDGTVAQQNALFEVNSNPIPLFICPSRRASNPWPKICINPGVAGFSPLLPSYCQSGNGTTCKLGRSDYAANSGSINSNPGSDPGPNKILTMEKWKWKYEGSDSTEQNGITYQRSQVTAGQITDGLSTTYCVAERYIPTEAYETGEWINDDLGMFAGHDGDTNIYTSSPWNGYNPPGSDSGPDLGQQYGSAHVSGVNVTMCDGSVTIVDYAIDPSIHQLMGGRNDQ